MTARTLDPQALPPLLTARQVAELLQLHINTVKKLCRIGKLPAFKAAAVWRIKREDLLAFMGSGTSPAGSGSQTAFAGLADGGLETAGQLAAEPARQAVPLESINNGVVATDSAHRITEQKRARAQREVLLERLRQQQQRLRILHEIDRAVLAAQSPSAIAEAAAKGILQVTDAARVGVGLWHIESNEFEILAVVGHIDPPGLPGSRFPLQDQPWYGQVSQGQAVVREDLAQKPDRSPEGQAAMAQGVLVYAVIPLRVGTETIGHLALARYSAGPLPDEDLALAQQSRGFAGGHHAPCEAPGGRAAGAAEARDAASGQRCCDPVARPGYRPGELAGLSGEADPV